MQICDIFVKKYKTLLYENKHETFCNITFAHINIPKVYVQK